jgi:hypothetical protein
MIRLRLVASALVVVALPGCVEGQGLESPTSPGAESEAIECDVVPGDLAETEDSVPFHLWVSNQSFDVDPVDIQVYVDDNQVVCDSFRVESQHTWILFELELDRGEHSLRAVGLDGQVEFVETFGVSDEHWGLVMFWTEEGRNFFTFGVEDEPILFQ